MEPKGRVQNGNDWRGALLLAVVCDSSQLLARQHLANPLHTYTPRMHPHDTVKCDIHLPRPHLYVLVEGRLRSSQSSGLLPRRKPPPFSARECPVLAC